MTDLPITLRDAQPDDVEALYALIAALAGHQGQSLFLRASVDVLRRDLSGQPPRFGAFLAVRADEIVGYATYTWNYSIWLGSDYMNIDDVFVSEQYRGAGIGEALMGRARDRCLEKGCHRVRWEVQPDNAGAIRFYERLGATLRAKGVFVWDV